ncbi:MAG: matrixin family metalloprotease [Vulcanimicrobiota bacterium]
MRLVLALCLALLVAQPALADKGSILNDLLHRAGGIRVGGVVIQVGGGSRSPRGFPRRQPAPPLPAPPQTTSPDGRPAGYAFISSGGRPIRVDPTVLPLTINPGDRRYAPAVANAITAWNQAGLGTFFALSDGPADLTVDWSGRGLSPGSRAETRMSRSAQQVVPSDIRVRPDGRDLPQLSRIMTHELGHVLGLDHSDFAGDIMYHSEQDYPGQLTQRDHQMLVWIYSQQNYTPVVGRRLATGGLVPQAFCR